MIAFAVATRLGFTPACSGAGDHQHTRDSRLFVSVADRKLCEGSIAGLLLMFGQFAF